MLNLRNSNSLSNEFGALLGKQVTYLPLKFTVEELPTVTTVGFHSEDTSPAHLEQFLICKYMLINRVLAILKERHSLVPGPGQ
jgi:hypothetical protein